MATKIKRLSEMCDTRLLDEIQAGLRGKDDLLEMLNEIRKRLYRLRTEEVVFHNAGAIAGPVPFRRPE